MATKEQTIYYRGLCEVLGKEPNADFDALNKADASDVIDELKCILNDKAGV
jgi:hypothetical protein